MFFGYNAAGPLTPALSYGSIDASGKATRFERFEAPYASMVHDFIVTENHVLFPILPITGSMERAMSGRPPYAWEPDKGAYVGVMKRNGSAKDIVWFRAEACYVFHVMNAWEDGNRIIADVMQFEEAPLFPHPDGRPTDPEKSRARHCRWTFDLSGDTDRFQQTYLDDLTGEFPRIDDRRAGLTNRHGWYACANPELPMFGALSGIVHVDGNGKRLGHYLLPAGDTISEPVFVERGEGCRGRRWLAAGGGLARAGEPQRPRGVQRHRCRSRPRRAGAARPPRARRFSRQLGRRAVAAPLVIADVTKRSLMHMPSIAADRLARPDPDPDLRRDHAPDDPAAAERPNHLQRRHPARLRPLDRLRVTYPVAPALGRIHRRDGRPSRCSNSIFGSHLRHFDTVKILLDPASILTY